MNNPFRSLHAPFNPVFRRIPGVIGGKYPVAGASTPVQIDATVTFTPTISMQVIRPKALSVGVTLTPTISKKLIAYRALSVALNTNPTLVRQAIRYKSLPVTVTLTPTISKFNVRPKSMSAVALIVSGGKLAVVSCEDKNIA